MSEQTLKSHEGRRVKPSSVIIYIVLTIFAVLAIIPLIWIIFVSLKSNASLFSDPFGIPKRLQIENYIQAWTNSNLGTAFLNSIVVNGITLVVSLVIGAMAAFAIVRLKWKLSGAAMIYFLIGMMVPIHCLLIPLFTMFAKVGLTNSLIGLIIPYVTFSLPITIFLMAGFFSSIPKELFESACIDGCNIYGCFAKIAIPLAKTGFFVTGLMTFIGNWNELLVAMVFISDNAKKTLPVALTSFVSPYSTNYVEMFAAIVISVLPTIIVYCLFSNQIVEGLTTGAVKG